MIVTGLRGLSVCRVVVFVVVVGLFGNRYVIGRPQSWQDNGREGQEDVPLRFSPELLLEPSLESAVSPINVLPDPPNHPPPHLLPQHQQNHEDDDLADVREVGSGHGGLNQDLDGPEEEWEQDPDILDSDVPPPPTWSPERRTPPLLQDKVVVPPVIEDDLNVDRIHGNLLGFHDEDGDEDLEVPELTLRLNRDLDPLRAAAANSGYIHAPRKRADQGTIPSPELAARDVDADGPALPKAHMPMPDDVPADPRQVVPWQEMVEKDVDVDRPIRPEASSPRSQPPRHEVDPFLQEWKELALDQLVGGDTDIHGEAENLVTSSVDMDTKINPFEDVDEDEDENEVPEELVRQVIKAMESPGSSRSRAAVASQQQQRPRHQEGDEMWEDIAEDDDDYDDDEEEGDYVDWVVQETAGPHSSRLITLIFETVDVPDEDSEDEEDSADAYEKELGIWQILTNFPFPMLLEHSDDSFDYLYDEDDDYEDDYYDDDDYDDDEEYEDYEDYEDSYDDDEEEAENGYDDDDEMNGDVDDSDELDDYFYSEVYDDCEDCDEDGNDDERVVKQEAAVLSLPPMLT
ncbi:uncharacterized protein LOC143280768 [Babylonia areolata]|uniref:uncharacterized protein LOC143280768 n=1 Tax=Babylonia areolata TaxID=304850 RepID=UPI003FD4857D